MNTFIEQGVNKWRPSLLPIPQNYDESPRTSRKDSNAVALHPLHGTEEMQRILAPCRPFPRLEHFGPHERRHATALAGKHAMPLIMLV
jgi:hypothetical protein